MTLHQLHQAKMSHTHRRCLRADEAKQRGKNRKECHCSCCETRRNIRHLLDRLHDVEAAEI